MTSCTPRNGENEPGNKGQEREALGFCSQIQDEAIPDCRLCPLPLWVLPDSLQGEAGRKQRVIPKLLQWNWNQTSTSKPEWMQQQCFIPHIFGLFFLCILMVQTFNPRNSSKNVHCTSRGGEAGTLTKGCFSKKAYFLFMPPINSEIPLQLISKVPFYYFFFFPSPSYKGQYKNLTSLTGNVTLGIRSPELLINTSVPNKKLYTSQDRLRHGSTLI